MVQLKSKHMIYLWLAALPRRELIGFLHHFWHLTLKETNLEQENWILNYMYGWEMVSLHTTIPFLLSPVLSSSSYNAAWQNYVHPCSMLIVLNIPMTLRKITSFPQAEASFHWYRTMWICLIAICINESCCLLTYALLISHASSPIEWVVIYFIWAIV